MKGRVETDDVLLDISTRPPNTTLLYYCMVIHVKQNLWNFTII
jgi:hypothetical protein